MQPSRPKNLNLFTIQFPIPAIVSILHRLTGLVLFLVIPLVLWTFSRSLTADGFLAFQQNIHDSIIIRFILWALLSSFFYHFIAGIRHLLMDIHIGVQLKTSRLLAFCTLILSILFAIMIGVWLW